MKSRCSVLIKTIFDDSQKLNNFLISHSTWEEYSKMLRFYKFYQFQISEKSDYTVSFSAYPGNLN